MGKNHTIHEGTRNSANRETSFFRGFVPLRVSSWIYHFLSRLLRRREFKFAHDWRAFGRHTYTTEDLANLLEENLPYFSRCLLIENDTLNWSALSLVVSRNRCLTVVILHQWRRRPRF